MYVHELSPSHTWAISIFGASTKPKFLEGRKEKKEEERMLLVQKNARGVNMK